MQCWQSDVYTSTFTHNLPYAYRNPLEKTNALSISFNKSFSDKLLRCCASFERVCFVVMAVVDVDVVVVVEQQ